MISVFSFCRVFFAAAALAAHSNSSDKGFRQKDLRFMLGLFLNWMDATIKGVDEAVHSTQVQRYLDELVRAGFASKTRSGRVPHYQLTRAGLVEMVSQVMRVPVTAPIEQFFIVYYFAKTYGARISAMVEQKENRLPRSFRVELEALLDHNELVNQQIRHIQIEIRKLNERIEETAGAAALAEKLVRQGAVVRDVVEAVSAQFPYDLNSHKPMKDLYNEIPAEVRLQELTVGNQFRVELMWRPLRAHLRNYLQVLETLKAQDFGSSGAA